MHPFPARAKATGRHCILGSGCFFLQVQRLTSIQGDGRMDCASAGEELKPHSCSSGSLVPNAYELEHGKTLSCACGGIKGDASTSWACSMQPLTYWMFEIQPRRSSPSFSGGEAAGMLAGQADRSSEEAGSTNAARRLNYAPKGALQAAAEAETGGTASATGGRARTGPVRQQRQLQAAGAADLEVQPNGGSRRLPGVGAVHGAPGTAAMGAGRRGGSQLALPEFLEWGGQQPAGEGLDVYIIERAGIPSQDCDPDSAICTPERREAQVRWKWDLLSAASHLGCTTLLA